MVRPSAPRIAALAAAVAALFLCVVTWCSPVRAAEPAAKGVVVLVLGEPPFGDQAWALAQGIYGSRALLPAGITEPRARTLVGQHAAATTPDTRELVELREGVHDEGAVSRRVLTAIAASTHAAAVAVVRASETPGHVQIRLYLAPRSAFDVTLYDGDPADAAWRSEVVRALERRFDPQATPAPVAAKTQPRRAETSAGARPFYKSPWFWGAVGAAVVLGGTALLVTKVASNDDVHVRVEPPASGTAALRF